MANNYRCRFGELDAIMTDGERLIIVEIRYRRSPAFGGALGSISAAKRARICRTTQHFVQAYPRWREAPIRFDVVALTGRLQQPELHWIAGAFTMQDLYRRPTH